MIIIKHSQKICSPCSRQQHLIKIKQLERYIPNQHSLCQKWFKRSQRKQQKATEKVEDLQHKIHQLQQQIRSVNDTTNISTKYRKVKIKSKEECQRELQQIPNHSKSNKWINHLNYDLFTEADCQYFTGFRRTKIIKQAQICKWDPEWIFHLRLRIKHYNPIEFHAKMFGMSCGKLTQWMDKTLHILNCNYAKPVLLNSKHLDQQYQSREKIKQNTPKFAFKLRGIDESDDKIIITCDSTYQYTETVQSNHDIRKKTTNMHKHHHLIKVHLWACANGQPIYALCVFGDGYHADGPIFEATLNAQYVKKCKEAVTNDNIFK